MLEANEQQRRIRTFYTLVITQVFSMIGSRLSSFAVGIWVYNETGNATPLALVGFFVVLPMVLASGVSGVLADRRDRRMVMVLSDAGQAVGTLLLLLSFASGNFQLWHLYLVAALNSLFGVFQGPAFSASVTMLIPDDKRDRANALMQLTQPSAGVIAPALGGFVYALVGVEGAILIDLLTFVGAMAVIFSVHIPRPTVTAEGLASRGTVWKEAFYGLTYLRQRPILFQIVLWIAFLNFMVAGVLVLGTPYILARTGSEESLGILMSIMNSGAIFGGIIYGVWGGTRPRMKTVMPGIILSALGLSAVGLSQVALPMALAMMAFMLPLPMINAAFQSIMQAKVAPDVQGRVFAVLGQMSMLMTPLAYLAAGPLADQVFEPAVGTAGWDTVAPLVGTGTGAGMGLMYLISGVVVLASALVMLARPRVRHMERDLPDYVAAPDPAAISAAAESGALSPAADLPAS